VFLEFIGPPVRVVRLGWGGQLPSSYLRPTTTWAWPVFAPAGPGATWSSKISAMEGPAISRRHCRSSVPLFVSSVWVGEGSCLPPTSVLRRHGHGRFSPPPGRAPPGVRRSARWRDQPYPGVIASVGRCCPRLDPGPVLQRGVPASLARPEAADPDRQPIMRDPSRDERGARSRVPCCDGLRPSRACHVHRSDTSAESG